MESDMKALLVSVSAAALMGAAFATGAHAQQAQPRTAPGATASAISSVDYVQSQAWGDLFEIESAKLAQQKAQNADVKRFAQMMIDDHTQSSAKLQQALKAGNLSATPPKTLDSRHSQALDQLNKTPAGQFDQAYLQSQVQGHREMLALNQTYSQTGDNSALKQFSAQAIPVVQKHLSELQQMASASRPGAAGGAGNSTNARTQSGGAVTTGGAPAVSGSSGSSGSMDVLDPGTGASSAPGAAGEQVIQHEPLGPGGPRQFNQPARDDGGLRDD
jgi:putative membrane protein